MADIKLAVGLYSCQTADNQRQGGVGHPFVTDDASIDNIIQDLDTQLKKLNEFIVSNKIPKFGVRGIFVAPEYLFSHSDGVAASRGVSDFVKDRIVEKLGALSKKYDGIIIIPGSIAWETGIMGKGVANIMMGGKLGQKELAKPIPIMEAKKHWGDVALADKVGAMVDRGVVKIAKYDDAKLKGEQDKVKLQKNTVVILHNGKVLGEYSKASDYKESKLDRVLHVPEPYPGLFTIKTHKGDLAIGLEVCLDHNCDTLGDWVRAKGVRPNLHVVCSAAVDPKNVWVKPGGWFLHASSKPQNTQILDSNKVEATDGAQSAGLAMQGLLLWLLTVQL